MDRLATEQLVWSTCIPRNTEDAQSLGFLNDRLKECVEKHEKCQLSTDLLENFDDPNPTRLLWLAGPREESVYLKESSFFGAARQQNPMHRDPKLRYLTLSHCWGKQSLPLLTQKNIGALLDGIPISGLPKTFRDAIRIARAIDIKYLWIDSLCILQDNIEDWSRESSRMRNVYYHAFCNLSATGAEDSTQGLFFEHSSTVDCAFWADVSWPEGTVKGDLQAPRYLVYVSDQWARSVEEGILNQRAWVMQERVLPRRAIHFTRDQVFWECLEHRASETFPLAIPDGLAQDWMLDKTSFKRALYDSHPNPDPTRLNEALDLDNDDDDDNDDDERALSSPRELKAWHDSMYYKWRVFMISYTRCKLTKSTDKLVALQGIAQQFARSLQINFYDQFAAGLWTAQLSMDLCWFNFQSKEASKPREWRAPSWSWASIDAQVHPSSVRHHRKCKGLTDLFELVDLDKKVERSGELLAASLKVKGTLIPATMSSQSCDPRWSMLKDSTMTVIMIKGNTNKYLRVFLDLPPANRPVGDLEEVLLFPVMACLHDDLPESAEISCSRVDALVLIPHDTTKREYARIGFLEVKKSDTKFFCPPQTGNPDIFTLV